MTTILGVNLFKFERLFAVGCVQSNNSSRLKDLNKSRSSMETECSARLGMAITQLGCAHRLTGSDRVQRDRAIREFLLVTAAIALWFDTSNALTLLRINETACVCFVVSIFKQSDFFVPLFQIMIIDQWQRKSKCLKIKLKRKFTGTGISLPCFIHQWILRRWETARRAESLAKISLCNLQDRGDNFRVLSVT